MLQRKLHSSADDKNDKKNKGLNDLVHSLSQTQAGSHQIVVYPEAGILREIYSHYVQEQLANNELVLMLPFYETVEGVKSNLSRFQTKRGEKINVAQHLDKGSLLILDGNETFFDENDGRDNEHSDHGRSNNNHSNIVSLLRIMQNQVKKLAKNGLTILLDAGCFFQNGGVDYVLRYERSIPQIFKDTIIKQVCIYHQKDYETRFNNSQKAKLLDSHGRSILMLDS